MTREQQDLSQLMANVYDLHQESESIAPAWLATEAMVVLDPNRDSHQLLYKAAHLYLRQIARTFCRRWDPEEPRTGLQHRLFPDLQDRYPTARTQKNDEPVYVRLESMTQEDVDYNVARLRAEGNAKLAHADSLEDWWHGRSVSNG